MANKTTLAILAVVVIVGVIFGYMYVSKPQVTSPTPGANQQTRTNPAATAPVGANTVKIQNFSFSPASLTVKAGDRVTWTNNDSVGHTVTADDGSFDTGVISPGQSGNITFSKAGSFSYHCSVHPTMKGTIVVQ